LKTDLQKLKNLNYSFKFLANNKIFLTGHTGFKGSWLSIMLHMFGAKLCGYALPPKKKSLFNDCNLKKIFKKSVYKDIRDFSSLTSSILGFKPKILIHMAAQPLVRLSYQNPRETFEVNSMGTLNILEIVKQFGFIKTVLIITSDKVYENLNKAVEYNEEDKLGSYDPYSNSKACAELITSAYRVSFFDKKKINIATARAGNVIGGGDYAIDRIIPDFFKALEGKKKIFIRQPNSVRPWQHVFDPLYGYIVLIKMMYNKEKINFSEFNFGPNKKNFIKVISLISKINQKLKNRVKVMIKKKKNEYEKENTVLMLDSKRAKKILKWKAICSIEKSLDLISEWYENKRNNGDVFEYCKKQIFNYLSLIRN